MVRREVAGSEPLLTPQELGHMLRVDPKTTARWARAGKVHSIRTIGNHRRYFLREVTALMNGETWEPEGGWPENSLG